MQCHGKKYLAKWNTVYKYIKQNVKEYFLEKYKNIMLKSLFLLVRLYIFDCMLFLVGNLKIHSMNL